MEVSWVWEYIRTNDKALRLLLSTFASTLTLILCNEERRKEPNYAENRKRDTRRVPQAIYSR